MSEKKTESLEEVILKSKELASSLEKRRLVFDEALVSSASEQELRFIINFFLQFKPHFIENSPNLERIKHFTKEKV